MTQDETLKLALEALENLINYDYSGQPDNGIDLAGAEAITAIKEALAQPAQQPQVRTGNCLLCGVCASEGHKIQAQRPWVGLTYDDKKQIARKANYHWEMTAGEYAERTGQLTEAKLKEKNFD